MSYGDKEPVGVEVGEGATSDGGNIYNPAENGMTVYSADEMFRDEQGMKRNNPLSPSNFDTFEAYERAINNTPEMKKNASATRIKLFKGGS
ncbi:hypothetical protein JCM21142_104523 [Saccharicrinis fermentans DSM 9555 = JCM 21142]|uniref:Uncharacterized protein n=2 Tax=Saccharicrinis fermentans TaxID=982 RepID=W7YM83_9BACT|nr:hypothetical protein JCM21142_104523 [Saccharicrinis fermentans DSM 9555 = JCM 21142]